MTKLEFIDKINDILIGLNTAESDALGSLYDELMRDAGWHPASELPPEEGEYVVKKEWGLARADLFYAKFENGKWSIPQVKWWIAPPKEDKK